ncbi:hypothetical protein Drorol1_Dr00025559 [Drosera rotundifolia]
MDLATSCYEFACGKFPTNLELMMGLFNCYVREYSYVKQQQTAIKMYKLANEERYLLWAVCSALWLGRRKVVSISNSDQSAPIYITIGDGGNQEGLANEMTEPQPSYSAFREASFGHGIFGIKNRTHAYFSRHRNQDGYAVEAESVWIRNRYWCVEEQPFVASI